MIFGEEEDGDDDDAAEVEREMKGEKKGGL